MNENIKMALNVLACSKPGLAQIYTEFLLQNNIVTEEQLNSELINVLTEDMEVPETIVGKIGRLVAAEQYARFS